MKFDLEAFLNGGLLKVAFYLFWVLVLALFVAGCFNYAGHWSVYLLFSVVANALLYCGFRKNAIFFDTFIGLFFWLGFWLKFTDRIIFAQGIFTLAPYFDGTPAAFDRGLLVASCGLFGLLLASFAREKFWYCYPKTLAETAHHGLLKFYQHHRKAVWAMFVLLIIFVGVSNIYLGVYQRGTLPQTKLPFGLNGVYTWLLMFGLASISTVIIRLEMLLNSAFSASAAGIGLFESFVTNTSMLSRGMLLNAGALLYGVASALKKHTVTVKVRSIFATALVFFVLFMTSVLVVNYLRVSIFQVKAEEVSASQIKGMVSPLFLSRWLGIEEVLAVTSHPELGWHVWNEAWKEKPTTQAEKTHFFDRVFTQVPQVEIDRSKFHFISTLPGVVAFFFYPGSFLFLLAGMFFLGWLAAGIEYLAYHLSGMNVILCAFFAQVLAFRFMNFGYAPAQSYLLLGTLVANLMIIYLANRILTLYYKKAIQ